MSSSARIDFYVLQNPPPSGRYKLACRIIEKAYRLGHKVYVKTDNTDDANMLDDLLWTFSQSSFIPHQLDADSDVEISHVFIGEHPSTREGTDVVISVSDEPVSEFNAYPRIIEIVGYENDEKASGRNRFRYYREHGIEPNTHKIAL